MHSTPKNMPKKFWSTMLAKDTCSHFLIYTTK